MWTWLLDGIKDKTFIGALLSALFGAFSGAFVAARLAAELSRQDRIRRELLACNVGIGLCYSITNAVLAQKKQSIKLIADIYQNKRSTMAAALIAWSLGYGWTIEIEYHLRGILPI